MYEFQKEPKNRHITKTFHFGKFEYSPPPKFEKRNRKNEYLTTSKNSPYYKLQLNSTSNTNQTDIFKSLNHSSKNIPLLTFEEYNTLITESMASYKTEKPESNNELITSRNTNKIPLNDFSRIRDTNHSSISKNYFLTEESMLKISVNSLDYRSPLESKQVLKKNRIIFNDVNKNFLTRQEQLYGDAIKSFDQETMKFKYKLPAIKVTNLMPKSISEPIITIEEINNIKEVNGTNHKSKNKSNKRKESIHFAEIIKDKSTKLFGYYKYPKRNFPEGREQSVFNYCHDSSQIIMWSGIASNHNSDVWSLNPDELEWSKFPSGNAYPPTGRFGHSGVLFQRKLYVFGGKSKTNEYTFLADLEFYNLDNNIWTSPSLNSQIILKLRKNHIAEMIGHQMIIHGGQTENNEFLNDTVLLNFSPMKWVVCTVNGEFPAPFLSGHAAALVVPSDIKFNSKFSVYKFPEIGISRLSNTKVIFNLYLILDQRKRLVCLRW